MYSFFYGYDTIVKGQGEKLTNASEEIPMNPVSEAIPGDIGKPWQDNLVSLSMQEYDLSLYSCFLLS